MITQDIEKRVLERLSLADEVSKYGTIVDNPGDEVWPFKAECVFPRNGVEGSYKEKVKVLLSKSKKIFLVNDEGRYCAGDALEFLHKALSSEPK